MAEPHQKLHGLGLRLILLALAFGIGYSVILMVVHYHQMNQFAFVFEQQSHEEESRLRAEIDLAGRTLRNFTYDYSYWDDLAKFVKKPDRAWARENINVALDSFQLDGIWVLNLQGEIIYSATTQGLQAIPLSRNEIQARVSRGYFSQFFVWLPTGLMEIRIAPIQASADSQRVTPPQGWLMAGRMWNAEGLRELKDTSGLTLEILTPQSEHLPSDFNSSRLAFTLELPGQDGKTTALLHATRHIPLVSGFARLTSRSIWLVGGSCLSLFIFLIVIIHYSYNVPIHTLTRAAVSPDYEPELGMLLRRSDEVSQLARIVQSMRTHQERMSVEILRRKNTEKMLQDTVIEQEVFARELHDDTLQSLYAIGMSMDGACRRGATNPDECVQIITQVVPEINRIIASLRIAIAGLESHHSDPDRLRQVLLRMLDTLAKPAGLIVEASIETAAIALLDRNQTFHLVRCIREVVTNTVKHGHARTFNLELKRETNTVEVTATDDGVGLPADAPERGGSGLQNLQRRADAMKANLRWETPPGGGLKITIEIPIHENQEA